jgi:hypothetical protein
MKFLTIATSRDAFSALPQAEKTRYNLESVKYILVIKKKMGDKLHFYFDPGGNRAYSIGDYESLEEYAQTLQTSTNAAGYTNVESIPLIEVDEKTLKAWIDSQKTAKKK